MVVISVDYTHDSLTGCLRLGGYDREPLTDEGVAERRLADVRVANYVNEA